MSIASLSISMVGTVTSSSSPSIQFPDLSFTSVSYTPVSTIHFPSKSKLKTLKHLRIKTHFPNFSLISQFHLCRASASFDFSGEEKAAKVRDPGGVGRLYVGNLPYSMSSSKLAEIFGEAGEVDSVEVVYDRVTDRSRGFAFVTMGSVEEAKEAIRLFNGAQVGGRSAKVNFPDVPKGGERKIVQQKIKDSYAGFIDTPNKIYAGNLGWGVTSQSLREAFAKQPGMLSAKVLYERDSGRSRGFGFVSFKSADDAESALNAMNGVEVEGRPLRLNLAKDGDNPPMERNTDKLDSSDLFSGMST